MIGDCCVNKTARGSLWAGERCICRRRWADPEKLGHRGGGNAGDGPVPDFHRDQFRPGNWKSEKLTVCTPDQIARIPDFQDFRFSPAQTYPESCRLGPVGEGVGGEECPDRRVHGLDLAFRAG